MRAADVVVDSVDVRLGGSRVVDGVSLTVEPGRFVGIVGPNGAGKTTLLRTMNGRVQPDRGGVSVGGDPVADLSAKAIGRRVATVPQRTELSFSFPVRAIVEMGRFPHRSRLGFSDDGAALVDRAMARTGIDHLADRPVTETSGGERQRVLLARALAQDTPVLLLDEPTASLDVGHQVGTLGLVRDLVRREGRTAVAAIHDLDLAARFCDELIVLSAGRRHASGPPGEVLTEPTVEAVFGTPAVVDRNPATDAPTVTALSARSPGDRRGRVHVVGGGGRARGLLHRLVGAGYAVTAGVLHEDDPDAAVGRGLGVETVTVPPFVPVDGSVDRAVELARAADVAVLADVPVGPTNAGNLAVAEAAPAVVVVDEGPTAVGPPDGDTDARIRAIVGDATTSDRDDLLAAVDEAVAASRSVAADGGS